MSKCRKKRNVREMSASQPCNETRFPLFEEVVNCCDSPFSWENDAYPDNQHSRPCKERERLASENRLQGRPRRGREGVRVSAFIDTGQRISKPERYLPEQQRRKKVRPLRRDRRRGCIFL